MAAFDLTRNGLSNVQVLRDGYTGWTNSGRSVTCVRNTIMQPSWGDDDVYTHVLGSDGTSLPHLSTAHYSNPEPPPLTHTHPAQSIVLQSGRAVMTRCVQHDGITSVC